MLFKVALIGREKVRLISIEEKRKVPGIFAFTDPIVTKDPGTPHPVCGVGGYG